MNRVLAVCVVLAVAAGSGLSRFRAAGEWTRIEDVRRNLAAQAALVNESIHSGVSGGMPDMDAVLKQVRRDSKHRIAWVHVRDANGAVRGHAGGRAAAMFPVEFVRSQLRNGRPVYAVMQAESGPVLLEAFAVRLPVRTREVRFLAVSQEAEELGVIEIAAHLDGLVTVREEARRGSSRAGLVNFL
ncbi:MAG: hypothetical protein ABI822_15075 [Bryobacteraceae bacterium]